MVKRKDVTTWIFAYECVSEAKRTLSGLKEYSSMWWENKNGHYVRWCSKFVS